MRITLRTMATFVFILFIFAQQAMMAQSLLAAETGDSFTTTAETVTDNKTGLMWAVHDNRADINLDGGIAYCEKYTAGGYTDWRLPTQDELATLYDPEGAGKDGGYSIVSQIKITGSCLWASDKKDARVASFDFDYGNPDWGHPNSTIDARVLPVRNVTP